MPALDLTASYGAQGLGGTRAAFAPAPASTARSPGRSPGSYADALRILRNRDYPNWNFAVTLSYPTVRQPGRRRNMRGRACSATRT